MAETESAIFKTTIKGSIDAVWRELTKTDEIQQAMFNAVMRTNGVEPGEKYAMRTPNDKYTSVVGEFLEIDPPNKLSYTFRFTAYDDPPCTVTYLLQESDGHVEFTLRVDDMPVGTKTAKSMRQGGPMITKVLKSLIETGGPPLSYRILGVVFKLLTPVMTPKKCLTENWT